MLTRHRRTLHTREARVDEDIVPDHVGLIHRAEPLEDRARVITPHNLDGTNREFRVFEEYEGGFAVAFPDGTKHQVDVYSDDSMALFFEAVGVAWLDITGLGHASWAPLVASSIRLGCPLTVLYAQPMSYSKPGPFYDLSQRVEGLKALPGFVRLSHEDESGIFVPLLGFEGSRFEYMVTKSDVDLQQTFPVVGAPGFMIEYVHEVFVENRLLFEQNAGLRRRVEYAKANCPFDLFWLLTDLRERDPSVVMKIAMIGTKPHALGAVLFAVHHPEQVELLYDHPVRSPGRSVGASKVCVYDIPALVSDLQVAS